MHVLFEAVLKQRNLSKAGDLFSLDDLQIIQDLRLVLTNIREIISAPEFGHNHNDQSLVEICITRITSAIRETGSIEIYADALVDLLEICLNYNLRPLNGGPDPPHAKIASDIMSRIFLNYSKKNVMKLALPVSVKFLHKGNKDLSRNMSSYLSLACVGNAELLAQHIQPIIDSVISGNYSLSKVLPQIYSVNRDPIKSHVMTLVSIFPNCENTEKMALLNLFALVAKDNPTLLEPSIHQLSDGLTSQATAHSTLQVFINMATTRPQPLADHTSIIKRTAENFPKTALASIQLMCLIAKTNQAKGQEALDFVLTMIGRLEEEKHSTVLKEILSLTNRYQPILTINVINKLSALESDTNSTASMRAYIQELRNDFNNKMSKERSSSTSGVTIVKVGGSSYGSKGELSHKNGSRHEISSTISTPANTTTVRNTTVNGRKSESRSTGRLPTHRSMTRLNNFDATRPPSSGGLHKSMTKLTSSQQNMARSSSQMVAAPTARSVTCITNNLSRPQAAASASAVGFGGPSSLTTSAATGGYMSGRVTICTTGPGASSPTKSMSSGSMSGIVQDPTLGREVVTVNVNQINEDLIRQVGAVSNTVNPPASHSYLQGVYNQRKTTATSTAPPYASGGNLIPTSTSTSSQPPSLALSSTTTPMGPILPLAPYELKHPTLSSGISQPLSSIGNDFPGISRVTSTSGPVPTRRSNLSNTLPSPRRRQQMKEMLEAKPSSKDDSSGVKPQNRMSVFEPYPMRDTVQHFCEKHLDKIKAYMESLMVRIPLPVKCTIEERKGRKFAKLHYACQGRTGEYCLYKTSFYTMKTRNPRPWIHLMFLALQARAASALSTREGSVSALKNCWEILKCESISFVTLVTGAFPPPKAQDSLMNELRSHRFFDVFEYNGTKTHWGCFLCNHPDRATYFVEEQEPVIKGELKEKKGGRWSMFKKWKSRYFTLSGDKLTYKDTTIGTGVEQTTSMTITQTLDVGSIRSVKVASKKNIPKAFEIFTDDRSFVLKAKDNSKAQEWIQCLSVARAHTQAKDSNLKKLAYGGSLGRLNHHHGRPPLHHSSLNHNLATLRTAV